MVFGASMGKGPAITIAVVMFSLAALIAMRQGRSSNNARYYYDLGTGELIALNTTEPSPVKLPSGNQGALARVFSCGACTSDQTFIGFLTGYAESDPPAGADGEETSGPLPVPSRQVAREPASAGAAINWINMQSPGGLEILDSPMKRCASGSPRECLPD